MGESSAQVSRCLVKPFAGQQVVTVPCGAAEALAGMSFDLMPGASGTQVSLRSDLTLCLHVTGVGTLLLKKCDGSPRQEFVYDLEARTLSQSGQCLALNMTTLGATDTKPLPDPTSFSPAVMATCPDLRQIRRPTDVAHAVEFTWAPTMGFVRSIYKSCNICLGVCGGTQPNELYA